MSIVPVFLYFLHNMTTKGVKMRIFCQKTALKTEKQNAKCDKKPISIFLQSYKECRQNIVKLLKYFINNSIFC